MNHPPAVFLSSTCYDLKQVRADLKAFIESLGLEPVISEYDSFPIDPGLTAVENCLRTVEAKADIFVLIVGGRYGAVQDQGKSVTNMEYLRARAKDVPIYVFIETSVLNAVSLWTANHDADFSSVVDSTKVFEFITQLRETDFVWTHSFEVAQEITSSLRIQLAYLFKDALEVRQHVKKAGLPPELAQLQGMPLRLVIERPPYWEYRLFAHALSQEIERAKQHRWDLEYHITLGQGAYLEDVSGVRNWLLKKLAEGRHIVDSSEHLINQVLPEAFGAPGVSGDAPKIVYVARRLASAYENAIEWARDARQTTAPDEYKPLVKIVGTFLNDIIRQIEVFTEEVLTKTESAIEKGTAVGGSQVVKAILTFNLSGEDEFQEEIDRLRVEGLY